jgi:hypothetical protein
VNLTPSTKSAFIAGIGLWCLIWASLFKADEFAEVGGIRRWVSFDRCLNWICQHKGTSLVGTELFNYGTHGITNPLGVTFAIGGTLVNMTMIYVLLPIRNRMKRRSTALSL